MCVSFELPRCIQAHVGFINFSWYVQSKSSSVHVFAAFSLVRGLKGVWAGGCSLIPPTPKMGRCSTSPVTSNCHILVLPARLSLHVYHLHASLYIDSKKERERLKEREIAMSVDCMSTPSGEPAAKRTCVSPATNSSPCCLGWAKI